MVDAKLVLGDSRNMTDIPDGSVQLVITSPPYYDLKSYEGASKHEDQLGSPVDFESYVENLNSVWKECVRVLAPDGKIAINIMPIFLSGKENGFERRSTKTMMTQIEKFMDETGEMFTFALYIWDKRKIVRFSSFGSYPYPPNIFSTMPYEWIMVFSKRGKRPPVSKEIKEASKLTTKEWQDWAVNSIWEMNPAKAKKEGHPAPFPEELPKRLIKLYSFVGDTVLDPFMGTGTTLQAAINLNRNGIGYEVSSDYMKLAEAKVGTALQNAKLGDSALFD
jgi:site-specific DNA-methyltransferase (adenine-specific)